MMKNEIKLKKFTPNLNDFCDKTSSRKLMSYVAYNLQQDWGQIWDEEDSTKH